MSKNNKITPSLLARHTKIEKTAKVIEAVAEVSFPQATSKTKRPSLNLALAIDTSGSMGAYGGMVSPLEHAKTAALALLDRLDPTDRIAIVAYSTSPYVVVASMPVSEARAVAREALASLDAFGSTALHAGWLAAAQQAAPHSNKYDISRVLLLSDGQATDGLKEPALLAGEAEKLAGAGITTSTYGLGLHFNEVLMTGMAVGGVARYAETADTLVPYFESDFAMLAQTVTRSVNVRILAKDVDTDEQLDVSLLGGAKLDNGSWRCGVGIAGATSWAAFSVAVGEHKKVHITAQWEIVGLDGTRQVIDSQLDLSRGKGQENQAISARISEVKAAAAAEAAAEAARRGDRIAAKHHLGTLRGLAGASAYACAVSNHLSTLEDSGDLAMLAKETAYVSASMRTRVVDANEKHDQMGQDRFGMRKVVQGKDAADEKTS